MDENVYCLICGWTGKKINLDHSLPPGHRSCPRCHASTDNIRSREISEFDMDDTIGPPCEWNPKINARYKEPFVSHAKATHYVGSPVRKGYSPWAICDNCLKLPKFKRFKYVLKINATLAPKDKR